MPELKEHQVIKEQIDTKIMGTVQIFFSVQNLVKTRWRQKHVVKKTCEKVYILQDYVKKKKQVRYTWGWIF